MIPRYQRILFWIITGAILLMSASLIHGCHQAYKRRAAFNDTTPIAAPTNAATEDVTFYLANDTDASITPTTAQIALPQDPTLRARTLLDQLLSTYAKPASAHPLSGGPAVDDVFLLTSPADHPTSSADFDPLQHAMPPAPTDTATLAVINLHGGFADGHPSGMLVEALTVQSIVGTLHAALPRLVEIRFLVNGEPRETLAGHADLLRAYPAEDTTTKPAPLLETPENMQP
ncbi:MAG: GerMN domain-containing protein [Acidobacteriota bacterium]|nr:GerMN domain-containing protein [Acidobacteriota bacterium]